MSLFEKRLRRIIREEINNITVGGNSLYDEFMESEYMRYKVIGYLMFREGYIVHGDKTAFYEFDTSRVRGGARGVYGYGAYFASEPYKCIEYGTNFVMTKKDRYAFLDLEENATQDMFDDFLSEIARLNYILDNTRNIREYEMAEKELESIKNLADGRILRSALHILARGERMTYENLNKILQNDYEQKQIADMYMAFGFDGFKAYNQYVIFNFEKLNSNIETLTRERIEDISRKA